MTLLRKLLIVSALVLLSVLAIAGLALRGLLQQRAHVRASLREYSALQLVESAEVRVLAAKLKLREPGVAAAQVLPGLQLALEDLRRYQALLGIYSEVLPPEISSDQQADAKAKTRSAATQLTGLIESLRGSPSDLQDGATRADALAAHLAGLLKVCTTFMNQTGLASEQDLRRTIFPVATLAVLVPFAALAVSLWQYRRIMLPLQRLRGWSRRIAGGDFSRPCETTGPREFAELGRDFNRMAAELQAFYKQMEEMVAAKSRELVRSERLASVGYLAAGVAHEINNPLNIISGYAELSTKRLRRAVASEQTTEVLKWQQVVRDEAFRCKQITGKLLSLARGGSDGRDSVSLTRVASDVALMVRGLRNLQGRGLNVAIDPSDALTVHANLTEMKQVLLNLTVNALEAVEARGEVVIDATRNGGWVELTVTDNGRGMDATTLERIFEPFYTDKRGVGDAGTGLGLSITFAIVADHGGRLRAESAGPGQGSRFTVCLPGAAAATETRSTARRVPEQQGTSL